LRVRDGFEAKPRIERHVPRNVSEGGQRDGRVPVICRPLADAQNQPCSETSSTVLRINIDLIEMSDLALDDFDKRKAHRNVAG
jgi:hypothetical protein